jgi:very-short-patch-repair endonuclease
MEPASVADVIRSHHQGLAHRRELLRAGCTRDQLDQAWRRGDVERVRHGLYALPGLPASVVQAARVGGVLAGVSALTLRGAWAPPNLRLVVSVPHNARDLRDPDDAGRRLGVAHPHVLVLRDATELTADERLAVSPSRAAAQALLHEPADRAVAVIDSALRLRSAVRPSLAAVHRHLRGRPAAGLLMLMDARAESGTKSVARVRLVERGLRPEIQVWITPEIRVDLLLDGWLVVECTSYEFHSSPKQYNEDRVRIAKLIALGYVVIEVSYHQVFDDWESVWAAIARLLTRGRPQNPTGGAPKAGKTVR